MSQLTVNGKPLVLAMPATVFDLLEHIDLDPSGVAVEVNGVSVPRACFDDTELNRGDRLKISNRTDG
ncbi:MAG: sulfur carrier protein ThiS [Syntrophotaleaceae bacterium]